MKIELDDRYVLTSDSRCIHLNVKEEIQSGKNAGDTRLRTVGYYKNIQDAIKACIQHDIRTDDSIDSFKRIADRVLEWEEKVEDICEEVFNE